MKRLFTIWLLALVAGAAAVAEPMNDNHQLTSLWKQYEEAQKADRPKKEAEILLKIRQEAAVKRLPLDFWDAATAYVSAVERRDWKQSEQLREDLEQQVQAFDDPIVTFQWMKEWKYAPKEELWQLVKSSRERLQGRNPGFYEDAARYLGGNLAPFIGTDYEYLLWVLLPYSALEDAHKALHEEVAGRYPNEPALEFFQIVNRSWPEAELPQLQKAYETLAQKYASRAFSLYPRAELLQLRFQALNRGGGVSADYKTLYADAQALEVERKSFKGDEALVVKGCTRAARLMDWLKESTLNVSVEDGKEIVLSLQNLSKADVTLYEGKKKLRTWNLTNPSQSFYVADTLKVAFPALPDGEYTIEGVSGKISRETIYGQYTLSIATRADAEGSKVYVTDYKTGIPLRSVTLNLLKGDKQTASTTLKLDGFTLLPEAFQSAMKESRTYYSLQAVSGDRKSKMANIQKYTPGSSFQDHLRCNIYKDRGAYNPGDTVRFKAILFSGDPSENLKVCAGKKVEVRLHDAEDNVLEILHLTTNEWGSVSGEFTLPTGLRNGRFEIEVVGAGYEGFRVDEFVLPTFDVSFDTREELYLPGDQVPVSGLLRSYSGHSLQDVRLTAKVNRYGSTIEEKEVKVQSDNTFRFEFLAPDSGLYNVELKVTEPSGETLSFTRGYYISDSISINAEVQDVADADVALSDEKQPRWGRYNPVYLVTSTNLRMKLQAMDGGGTAVPLPVSYEVKKADGSILLSGEMPSGELLSLQLPESGVYEVHATVRTTKADGKPITGEETFRIFLQLPKDKILCPAVERFFLSEKQEIPEGGAIQARLGTSAGDAYAVVTVFGKGRKVLEARMLRVKNSSVENLSIPYQTAWGEAVRLQLFYFLDGKSVTYDRQYRLAKDRYTLPLSFTRFQDKAFPGTSYTFSLQTAPGTEVLAAAWDKSLDAVAPNSWPLVHLRDIGIENVYVSAVCGGLGGSSAYPRYEGRLLTKNAMRELPASTITMASPAYDIVDDAVAEEEEAIAFQLVEQKPSFGMGYEDVKVREDFSSALTFQPHLRPGADGTLSFTLRTSDKLSTFYVRAYAHDGGMRNASAEGEMLVSLPVKVQLLEPRFLYKGDVYQAAVTLSSLADAPVSGKILFQAGNRMQEVPVTVLPGETVTSSFTVEATEVTDALLLKAVFKADDFADAVQVSVPVYPAAQLLTEVHSAVLRAGMDREALLQDLRSRFVNVPSENAILKEITVLDMVRDAIPAHVEPAGNDVLSLSEAWYVRLLSAAQKALEDPVSAGASAQLSAPGGAGSSGAGNDSTASEEQASPGANISADAPDEACSSEASALLQKILSCRNADGGFGWFEGMSSSPVITAVLLERFAKLRARGFEVPDVETSVKYLDQKQLEENRPYWCGYLSDAQYLYVRSFYPEVPFQVKPATKSSEKRLKEFRKEAKRYLTPSAKDGRGLQGRILEKARRLLTLQHLSGSSEGIALAGAWGVSLGTRSKLQKSLKADVQSLLEYAVEHRDGGWYYPNAVMPWRGLLESEAYAHALLCDLLWATEGDTLSGAFARTGSRSDAEERVSPSVVSDGIRLWLMLQKETQKWESEPAYIDAITSILDGSEAVLQTRVLALSATYEAPFSKIKEAGNGFTIGRHFFRESGEALHEGDTLKVGEKIRVTYDIWNGENRSFVKLTAGREAALSPVQQLSGSVGYGIIVPLSGRMAWGFYPQGYRNVKASCTEYCFDSYPEEKTSLSEEFFVTRAGVFQAPVVTIESLYAPHYRANSGYRAPLKAVR